MCDIGDFDDPLGKDSNYEVSKYAIELTPLQCAYLHKLLPGNGYRFQPEDTAKSQMSKRKNKKKTAKSGLTDSVISNSDKMSSSERNVPDSSSINSKKISSTPSKAVVPSEMAESAKDNFSRDLGGNHDSFKQFNPSESAESGKKLLIFASFFWKKYLSYLLHS